MEFRAGVWYPPCLSAAAWMILAVMVGKLSEKISLSSIIGSQLHASILLSLISV